MTLKLKQTLAELGARQADLARHLDVSPATIAQLINHDIWPRSIARDAMELGIRGYLQLQGAGERAIADAFEEVEPPCANTMTPAPSASPVSTKTDDLEDDSMLLAKQPLLPATKRQFGLHRDPFGELTSADDMFVSSDIRYIREAMYQAARHDGFLAIVGESGAGKSTLRRDLVHRLEAESAPVIVIEPYVLGMEDNDVKGKTLKSTHVAESIMAAVAPLEHVKRSPEARFAQLHKALKGSRNSGYRHVLIIEEAHAIPVPTLKHLKRMRDQLEVGYDKLLSIVLIGQPELAIKLSPRNGDVREVAQRIEIAELPPVSVADLEQHLAHRVGRAGIQLDQLIDDSGVQAIVERLSSSGRDRSSQLYPLAIGNLFIAGLNLAASIGEDRITADVIRGV